MSCDWRGPLSAAVPVGLPDELTAALTAASDWLRELRESGPDLTENAHRKTAHEAVELAANPTLEEWADVAICLVGTAIGQRWELGELARAVAVKVAVNRGRRWVQQSDGTWQHEQQAAS